MKIFKKNENKPFSSIDFWEDRYRKKSNSGKGSYGKVAEFKAKIINEFVSENEIKSIAEFGCGDGSQLELATYPNYLGVDVSSSVIKLCINKFKMDVTKSFFAYIPGCFKNPENFIKADLTLSLDVIYHLTEDTFFEEYIHNIFRCSNKFVIIYSTNFSSVQESSHIKHRIWTKFVENHYSNYSLLKHIKNEYPQLSSCEFFIYERKT